MLMNITTDMSRRGNSLSMTTEHRGMGLAECVYGHDVMWSNRTVHWHPLGVRGRRERGEMITAVVLNLWPLIVIQLPFYHCLDDLYIKFVETIAMMDSSAVMTIICGLVWNIPSKTFAQSLLLLIDRRRASFVVTFSLITVWPEELARSYNNACSIGPSQLFWPHCITIEHKGMGLVLNGITIMMSRSISNNDVILRSEGVKKVMIATMIDTLPLIIIIQLP